MGVCVLTAHRVGLGLLGGSGSASPAPPAPPAPVPPAPAPRLPLSCSVVSSRRLCRQDRSPRSPPAVRMQLGGLWGAQSVRQPHPPIRERPRHPQETSRASATPPRPGSPPAGRANVGAVHSHPGPLVSRVLSFADVSRAVPRLGFQLRSARLLSQHPLRGEHASRFCVGRGRHLAVADCAAVSVRVRLVRLFPCSGHRLTGSCRATGHLPRCQPHAVYVRLSCSLGFPGTFPATRRRPFSACRHHGGQERVAAALSCPLCSVVQCALVRAVSSHASPPRTPSSDLMSEKLTP